MNLLSIALVLLCVALPAHAHEGHDKAFADKNAMVATEQKVRISPEGQAGIGLKTEVVKSERLGTSLEITGTVEPADNRIHSVTSPVSGVIRRLEVQQNDAVRKGQVLATVYSADVAGVLADLIDQVAAIQAEITKVEAQAANDLDIQSRDVQHFTVDVDREKRLLAEGITARRTYLDAIHALDVAKARLDGTKKQLARNAMALQARQKALTEATKRKLGIMGLPAAEIERALRSGKVSAEVPIHSPAAGIVLTREVTNGESIDTTRKLISIVNLSPVWISLNLNQEQLEHIRIGQQVEVKPASGAAIIGKISSIAPVVDPSERTIHVRVIAENRAGVLRPQMFVTARVTTGTQPAGSITVATEAVIEDAGKHWVYVGYGNDFQPVAVKLGVRVGDRTQVLDGLYEGDRVVVNGARQIRAQALLSASRSTDQHEHGKAVAATEPSSRNPIVLAIVLLGGITIGLIVAVIASGLTRRKTSVDEKHKVPLP